MDLDLVQALENLQVTTRGTPAGSSRQQEKALETQFNLLLKISDNQGSARPSLFTRSTKAFMISGQKTMLLLVIFLRIFF
jgi:hypothetical protein